MFALGPMAAHAAAPDQSLGVTALTHVRVIDGTGRPPLEDATIVIQGDHILAIHAGTGAAPIGCAGARFARRHGDAGADQRSRSSGVGCQDGQNSATAYTAENVLAELRQYESYGVTSMLSLGVNRDLLYSIRQQQRARQTGWRHGLYGRPRYRCSGRGSPLAGCPGSDLPPGDSGRSPRRSGRVWPSGMQTWSRSGSTAWVEPNLPCHLRSTVR